MSKSSKLFFVAVGLLVVSFQVQASSWNCFAQKWTGHSYSAVGVSVKGGDKNYAKSYAERYCTNHMNPIGLHCKVTGCTKLPF